MTSAQPPTRTPKFRAWVSAAEYLSPRMRRLVLTDPSLAAHTWPLGCEIAVVLAGEDGREVRRRYTVRVAAAESITIDAVLHGPGAGSTWAASAQVGDVVEMSGPRGEIPLPAGEPVLALADEAGLPAIAAVAEAAAMPMRVLAEIADLGETYPLPQSAQPTWITRSDHPAGTPDLFLGLLDQLDEAYGYAYILAESRAALTLREALQRRGIHRSAIYYKGYWNLHSRATR